MDPVWPQVAENAEMKQKLRLRLKRKLTLYASALTTCFRSLLSLLAPMNIVIQECVHDFPGMSMHAYICEFELQGSYACDVCTSARGVWVTELYIDAKMISKKVTSQFFIYTFLGKLHYL